jgi:two-component system, OmpR family, response regulator
MTRILICEDDRKIASDIGDILTANAYLVEIVKDGEEAWFRGDTEDYAAIILDLGLPKLDGLSVLKRWRANGRKMPVLILTARGAWSERVEGIDTGGDDYLVKPFQPEELLARLRALVRRSAGLATSQLEFDGLILDERLMRLSLRGKPIHLTLLEYRLVAYFMHHRARVISQHELTEQVYSHDETPDSNALEALISRVRRKICVDLIETKRGFGYISRATI